MRQFIPLSIPNFEGNEQKYVEEAVKQGWVSTGGKYVEDLEEKMAEYIKAEDVAVCQSGTAGLHLALIDLGVSSNDMVIVPSLTFIAAVNPVKYQFAQPIFMDCDDSLCVDPDKIEKFCKEECYIKGNGLYHKETNKQVKALIVVHVFGNLADMERIMAIAEKYHLAVIEDATEALGSYYVEGKYKGFFAGTIGDYGAYSFNGNKIITTGGGGAVTARDSKRVQHMRYLSTQAKDDALCYVHHEVGYTYRMTNLQAALGVAQLEELPEFVCRKQKNYELYKCLLEEEKLGRLIPFREGTNSNKWFYAYEIAMEKIHGSLYDVIVNLDQRNIQTRPIWGLIPMQRPYVREIAYDITKAAYYTERVINLPCSTQITEEEITYVAEQLKEVLKERRI